MPKTVLIVEDEKAIAKAVGEKLENNGYSPEYSSNGEEGLKQALKNHPDLILLDIDMPKMDGNAMLKELRKDPWGATVPVIVLSNISDPSRMQESLESGVEDYLLKVAWSLDDLLKLIEQKIKFDEQDEDNTSN